MLGGSFDGIVDANLLPWAQLSWGAGGSQAITAVAASLVQRLDWQEMAFTLPGPPQPHCIPWHTLLLFQTKQSLLVDMHCLYLMHQRLQRMITANASGDVTVINECHCSQLSHDSPPTELYLLSAADTAQMDISCRRWGSLSLW